MNFSGWRKDENTKNGNQAFDSHNFFFKRKETSGAKRFAVCRKISVPPSHTVFRNIE